MRLALAQLAEEFFLLRALASGVAQQLLLGELHFK